MLIWHLRSVSSRALFRLGLTCGPASGGLEPSNKPDLPLRLSESRLQVDEQRGTTSRQAQAASLRADQRAPASWPARSWAPSWGPPDSAWGLHGPPPDSASSWAWCTSLRPCAHDDHSKAAGLSIQPPPHSKAATKVPDRPIEKGLDRQMRRRRA